MKRVYVLVIAGFMPALYAQSEEKEQRIMVSGGALVETNMTGFLHSGFTDGNSRMKAGFVIGGFVNLTVSHHFSVQGEMSVVRKHSDFSWDRGGGCYRYWGMEIPVYAMYRHPFRNGGQIYFGVGPYTNFGLDATFKDASGILDLYEKDATTGLPPMKDSDTGFGIKVGYEFSCGLQVNTSYKVS
ncbi:MAG: outer membrane beta-barrel protein, partial [Bacteroidaceae bacterium]